MNVGILVTSLSYLRSFTLAVSLSTWINELIVSKQYTYHKLLSALHKNDIDIIKSFLIQPDARHTFRYFLYNSFYDCEKLSDELIDILVNDSKINLGKRKHTLINESIQRGYLKIVKGIIEYDSPEFIFDGKRDDYIEEAIIYNYIDIAQYLITYDKYACFDQLLIKLMLRPQYAKIFLDLEPKIYSYDEAFELCEDVKIRNILISKGAKKPEFELSYLMNLVSTNNIVELQILLDNGLNINVYGGALISEAGTIEMIKFLVENRINMHISNSKILFRPDITYESLKYLLEHGADVHAQGNRLLHEYPDDNVIKLIIAHGININCHNGYAMKLYCQHGAPIEKIHDFVNNGAVINSKHVKHAIFFKRFNLAIKLMNEYNIKLDPNILFDACKGNQSIKIIEFLISQGVDIHFDNDKALRSSRKTCIIKRLVESGANIHANDDELLRNLFYEHDNDAIMNLQTAIETGIDISAKNNKLLRNLFYEHDNYGLKLIKTALECGADIHANNNELLTSSEQNHVETVLMLLGYEVQNNVNYYIIKKFLEDHNINI